MAGVDTSRSLWRFGRLQEAAIWGIFSLMGLHNLSFFVQDREYVGMNESTKLKYKLESNLRKLKSRGKLTKAAINKLLNDYQNELQKIDVLIDFNMDNGESGADLSPSENNFSGNFRVEEVATHLSLLDVATPRSVEGAFETSSYQNLSNFLREDSENVNKLIPEVTLACSEREFVLPESQQSERQDSSYSKASTGKEKTLPASTPTLWGVNRCNMSDDEVRSIVEELQSISESFSEDDDFDFSQVCFDFSNYVLLIVGF
jgi:hypothetical protein